MMGCKQKEGESIRVYYDRFMLAMLNVSGHEEFLVTGIFSQGLFLVPLSKKMQGTVSQSRDGIKYIVEKYLRKIEGEERKEAKLKVFTNAYIKIEEATSHSNNGHRECQDGGHDKQNHHLRHSF